MGTPLLKAIGILVGLLLSASAKSYIDCDTYEGIYGDCIFMNTQEAAAEKQEAAVVRDIPELDWIAKSGETSAKYLRYRQYGAGGDAGDYFFIQDGGLRKIPTNLENNGDIEIDWYFDGIKANEICSDNLCLPSVSGESILDDRETITFCQAQLSKDGRMVSIKINTKKCSPTNQEIINLVDEFAV